jgi:ferredoxin
MDLILAGYDPVALDTTVSKIIHLDPNLVIHIKKAELKGLGTMNLENVNFVGEEIKDVERPFKLPKMRFNNIPIPRKLMNSAAKSIFAASISFNSKKCKLCGTCWKNCPVQAITPPENLTSGRTPIWNKKKCITCYCCAELCPYEAVNFKVNIAKNIFKSWIGWLLIAIIILLVALLISIF